MLGGQPNHGWRLCLPLKLHASGLDFRLYDSSDVKTYLLLWQPDALAVCQAHLNLLVRFPLLPLVVQFYLLLIPCLCFISFLYLDLYVLGDDALIY